MLEPIAADDVLASLTVRPLGESSPSFYDTGRVTTLAPWLAGRADRLAFLLDHQRPDGTWGGTGGYALVPTLSATEALLTLSREGGAGAGRIAASAARGLAALRALLDGGVALPDLVAAELIAPALVADLNAHLDRLTAEPITGLDAWASGTLPLPRGSDPGTLALARERLRATGEVTAKLWHSLEIMGPLARQARTVRPAGGAVGCSPAATAAWLGTPPIAEPASISFLESAVAAYGGALPGTYPLYRFERIWVIGALIGAGLDVRVPEPVMADLEQSLAAGAIGGAPGLPPDADTTGAGLATLARRGRPLAPDRLWEFELEDHFCCWHGERTASPTANAHVLEAFAESPGRGPRHEAAVRKIARWLAGVQHADGSWTDKWHASPYYATSHCALALDLAADGRDAVRRAVDWTLDTQNADGSWGIWGGTSEETAYAVNVLLRTRPGRADPRGPSAAARARLFLRRQDPDRHPPLWQAKELYAPLAICRAVRLAALRLLDTACDGDRPS
ncbi:prenyltransferase/squalene oxidase repeat-containing protein [Nonomuraea sp. NPDC050227]|uniref:prenyltransferase/squalene oxidase repeat-containing protein n=1 Tax=Nonomuraea sp. NPDC050227 TaxID=3364360 RepID=UPI0037B8F43C